MTNDLHRLTLSESKTIQAAICDEGNRLSSQISSITPDIQRTLDDSFSKIGKPLECQLDNLEKLIVTSLQSLRNEEAQGPRGKDFSEEPAIRLERQRSAAKISRLVQGQTLFGIQCHCSPCNPGSHQASCFYSVRSLKKAKFTGQIIFFNLMFRWKIEAQYSPRAFPRDFRVYPNFTIRAVNQNSPAWQILGETFLPHIYCPSHLWKVVGPLRERCYRGLRLLHQCFAEEKAWPTDVNDSGLTIFHVRPS